MAISKKKKVHCIVVEVIDNLFVPDFFQTFIPVCVVSGVFSKNPFRMLEPHAGYTIPYEHSISFVSYFVLVMRNMLPASLGVLFWAVAAQLDGIALNCLSYPPPHFPSFLPSPFPIVAVLP